MLNMAGGLWITSYHVCSGTMLDIFDTQPLTLLIQNLSKLTILAKLVELNYYGAVPPSQCFFKRQWINLVLLQSRERTDFVETTFR